MKKILKGNVIPFNELHIQTNQSPTNEYKIMKKTKYYENGKIWKMKETIHFYLCINIIFFFKKGPFDLNAMDDMVNK